MTIQREDEIRLGLVDHRAVVGVRCAATAHGRLCGPSMVRLMDGDDRDFLVLKNWEIERGECGVVVSYPDHGAAWGAARSRRLGNWLPYGGGRKPADSKVARVSQKFA